MQGSTPLPRVFVVGCGRSGTTLLRLMLNAHPDLAIPGESHFIPSAYARWSRGKLGGGRLAEAVAREEHVQRWRLDPEVLERRLTAADMNDFASVVAAFFSAYADMQGKRCWGDKTPRYVLEMPLLAELYPGVCFVHLIRDGRSVAMSYRSLGRYPQRTHQAILRWKRWVGEGRRVGSTLGSRYLEVRYEDLVDAPSATLQRICSMIGLSMQPSMLGYQKTASEMLSTDPMAIHHQRTSLRPTPGLRDWRRDMALNDMEVCEAIAGPLLADLGYERAVPKTRLSTRERVLALQTVDGLHRRGSRLAKVIRRGNGIVRRTGRSENR
jgi:hypothetical protein